MSDPVYSPDGKYMWSGSEWIPVPPGTTQNASINLQDSVVSGDVIINNKVEAILPINTCRICNKEGMFDVMTCSKCNEKQCESCTENKGNIFTCKKCVEPPRLTTNQMRKQQHRANLINRGKAQAERESAARNEQNALANMPNSNQMRLVNGGDAAKLLEQVRIRQEREYRQAQEKQAKKDAKAQAKQAKKDAKAQAKQAKKDARKK